MQPHQSEQPDAFQYGKLVELPTVTNALLADRNSAIDLAGDQVAVDHAVDGGRSAFGYVVVLLPMVVLYLHFILAYGHTYLMRRDENVMFVIFDTLRRGATQNSIFAMVISPGFISMMRPLLWLGDIMILGRSICMISALGCAVLAAVIAKRLFESSMYTPLLTLALLVSSPLFVQEGTNFRLNLLSMLCALASVALLVGMIRVNAKYSLVEILIAGLLFGLALQVKALALAILPFDMYLLWQMPRRGRPIIHRSGTYIGIAALYLIGCFLPMLLIATLGGAGGSPLDTQLRMQLDAAGDAGVLLRLSHTIATFWDFVVAHFWLCVFFLLAIVGVYIPARSFQKAEDTNGIAPQDVLSRSGRWSDRQAIRILVCWSATTLAMFLVNFPSWDHHYVYLLVPVAIGAAFFLECAGKRIFKARVIAEAPGRRSRLFAPTLLVCVGAAISGTFATASALAREQLTNDVVSIAQMVQERTVPTDIIWSDNPVFPLLAARSTDPQLAEWSIKRILSGQLSESMLFSLFVRNPPRVVIAYDGLLDAFPQVVQCISNISEISPVSLNHQRIYWVDQQKVSQFSRCRAKTGP
jgi:hypothetical protein